ncbi:MAG: MBL fold metallo-hydrolase [Proteobacteria bacterium]|nr:MBL fold metallo-hydrolase [Pseudomonadota bacterium]
MIEKILDGLYRIEIPLPKNPLKVTNSFVLTSEERNLIIDTGFNQKECMEAMQAGLREIEVDLTQTDFFATHLHADHHGLIGELSEPSAVKYMGHVDAKHMERGSSWEDMLVYGSMNGFPDEELRAATVNHPGRKHSSPNKVQWTHVKEGDVVTIGDYALECVETPGHTWGHVCLYDSAKKILFSGDHILGDITPNIQVWSSEDDPLRSYIESLNKVAELEVDLMLPGHRSLIPDSRARIQALKKHHLVRCNEVLDILRKGARHAYLTAAEMSWDIRADSWDDFPLMQKWFATGEAVAHLRFLEKKGLIQKDDAPEGITTYQLTEADATLQSVD